MVGYEGDNIGLVINDEDALRSSALVSHVKKLSATQRLRQLALCHEYVTTPLHSLARVRPASFAIHPFQ